jgi:S1-C subfamily serine protease
MSTAEPRPGPRLRIVHLSGPRAGQVDEILGLPATIGSQAGCDVLLSGLAPVHARLIPEGEDVLVQAAGDGISLAGEPVHEAPLRDGDVLVLGEDGPRLRVEHKGPRPPSLLQTGAFAFRQRLDARHAFRLALLVLAVVGGAVVVWSLVEAHRLRQQVARLEGAVRHAEQERQRFEARVEDERKRNDSERASLTDRIEESKGRAEQLERRLAEGSAGEQALRRELETARARLTTLEEERAAAERIIRNYGAGVCLIHGSYAFFDTTGRPLRYALDDQGKPAHGEDGSLHLAADSPGPIHSVDYFGTGFLVDRKGLILTNRHVAEPWWKDEMSGPLGAAGFRPRFLHLYAFFPKIPDRLPLTAVARSESFDLAVLRADLGKQRAPVLPLDASGTAAVAGHPVVVVGYPTGLEAILAKTESSVAEEVLAAAGTSAERITDALAKRGLIRPSTTQGHIADITTSDIVFDAPTTQGGSGAPVFNRAGQVVAIEYAVLQRFGGNAFGVPIRHARALIKEARAK